MATTTLRQSCEWCATCLEVDGYPNAAERIVDVFSAACEARGRADITWHPRTSQVVGIAYSERRSDGTTHHVANMDGGQPLLDLDRLRADAVEAVLYRWNRGQRYSLSAILRALTDDYVLPD